MVQWRARANSKKQKYTVSVVTDNYSAYQAITDACNKANQDTKVKKQLNEATK